MIILAGTERYVEIALLRRKRLTPLYSRFISFSMIVQLAQQTTSFLAGETACRLNRKSLRCRAADIVLLAIINASLHLLFAILFDDFRSSVIYLLRPIKRPDIGMTSSFFITADVLREKLTIYQYVEIFVEHLVIMKVSILHLVFTSSDF